jgi:predicted small metal-binding protein
MLSSKIKFEMDINHHDELLETIWEHMKETKRGKESRGEGDY